mgnify:FL=1
MDFYYPLARTLLQKAQKISLLILDVDGVLSDGKIYYSNTGDQAKSFHIQDGLGLVLLRDANIQSAIVTGRDDYCVAKRVKELKIPYYYPANRYKAAALADLLQKTGLKNENCAYIGDDIIDLPILKQVGLATAVKNAHPLILPYCDYICQHKGGEGAVREVIDLILYSQDKLSTDEEQFK